MIFQFQLYNNIQMQVSPANPETELIPEPQQNLILSIPSSFYYSLINNNRHLLQTGSFNLFLIKNSHKNLLMFQIGHLSVTLDEDWKIIKNQYQDVTSYYMIDPFDNLTSLIIDKSSGDKLNMEAYFKQVSSYSQSLDINNQNNHQQILQTNWTAYNQKPPCNLDGFKKFISSTGHFVGKGIASLSNKINDYWKKDQQLPQVQQQQSWYNKLKNKAGTFFGKTSKAVSQVMNPVVQKGKELKCKISNKIDQSDNNSMKYMKDVASLTSEAAKNMYYGAKTAFTGRSQFYSEQNSPIKFRQSCQQKKQSKSDCENQPSSVDLSSSGVNDKLLDK